MYPILRAVILDVMCCNPMPPSFLGWASVVFLMFLIVS